MTKLQLGIQAMTAIFGLGSILSICALDRVLAQEKVSPAALAWEDVAGYWRDVNDVNKAEALIGQAQDDKRKKQDALNIRIQALQTKCAAMVPARMVSSASDEQAVALKVPKDTPICVVAPPAEKPKDSATEPDQKNPSQKTATHSSQNEK